MVSVTTYKFDCQNYILVVQTSPNNEADGPGNIGHPRVTSDAMIRHKSHILSLASPVRKKKNGLHLIFPISVDNTTFHSTGKTGKSAVMTHTSLSPASTASIQLPDLIHWIPSMDYFLFKKCILLKYSWFTICSFLLYWKMIQLHIHTLFFIFFCIRVYHRILDIVPYAVQ